MITTSTDSVVLPEEHLLFQHEFHPYGGSSLLIKVLVVKTLRGVRDVSRAYGLRVNGRTRAYVDSRQGSMRNDVGERVFYADSRYFCVMVFSQRFLNIDTIAHESVHAAYAITKRACLDPWRSVYAVDEEHIAYPTGFITDYLVKLFMKEGLLKWT